MPVRLCIMLSSLGTILSVAECIPCTGSNRRKKDIDAREVTRRKLLVAKKGTPPPCQHTPPHTCTNFIVKLHAHVCGSCSASYGYRYGR